MWLWAGRAQDLPKPGDFFVREVAGANVIVVRGEDGAVRAFHNTCRHRGTLLCAEESGAFPGRIRCPYHAWTYDLAGRLVGAPHMDKVEGFREEDHPLGAVATAEWDGHVFMNLGDAPIPFVRHAQDLVDRLRPWRMEELVRVERRVYPVRANWKLDRAELLRVPALPGRAPAAARAVPLHERRERRAPRHLAGRPHGPARRRRDAQPGRQERARLPARPARAAHARGPLLRAAAEPAAEPAPRLHADADALAARGRPHGRDREWSFHPDAIAAPGFDPSSPIEFWDLTNRQDWELSERAQAGISSLGYRPGPYSNREELLHAFDALVVERTRE